MEQVGTSTNHNSRMRKTTCAIFRWNRVMKSSSPRRFYTIAGKQSPSNSEFFASHVFAFASLLSDYSWPCGDKFFMLTLSFRGLHRLFLAWSISHWFHGRILRLYEPPVGSTLILSSCLRRTWRLWHFFFGKAQETVTSLSQGLTIWLELEKDRISFWRYFALSNYLSFVPSWTHVNSLIVFFSHASTLSVHKKPTRLIWSIVQQFSSC